jgi:hypothetical protein
MYKVFAYFRKIFSRSDPEEPDGMETALNMPRRESMVTTRNYS